MRHLPIVLCASAATLGYASLASAGNPLTFTLDLTAPCTSSGCAAQTKHPGDIALSLGATDFSYQPGPSNSFLSQLAVTAPVVCDEISGTGAGAAGALRFSPIFNNAAPGGLLEFGAGGASVVDFGAISYDGSSPAGVAGIYSNYGATLPPQVTCYQINSVSDNTLVTASEPSGIFTSKFENALTTHFPDEPWVSVQTVVSPQSSARRGDGVSGVTASNAFGYVIEVHNASAANGWRLALGYDYNFFDPANGDPNILSAPKWCVLGANIPQPGPVSGSASCSSSSTTHTFALNDIVAGSSSIFVYVEYSTSSTGSMGWNSLTAANFPAAAVIFPPFGTYPQRLDDKVAVASANNRPVLNVSSIIGSNNNASTTTTLKNADGHSIATGLTFGNSVNTTGAATVDPIAYFVDPNSNTTLPGNLASDGITVNNVSCNDPQGVLAGALTSSNFATSATARGGLALSFNFTQAGNLFVPGTATCTATFTAPGSTGGGVGPSISTTGTFAISMQQATATHFSVTAPANAVAGTAGSVVVSALDGGDNVVASYNGAVSLSSSDNNAVFAPNGGTLTAGTGTFSVTFKGAGAQTVSANDAVNSISGISDSVAVSAGAATHLKFNVPGSATAGTAFTFVVTALDQFNNTADSYVGPVQFGSSDAGAVLPSASALAFGVGTFQATLNTTGNQTLNAADVGTPSISGNSAAINVTP